MMCLSRQVDPLSIAPAQTMTNVSELSHQQLRSLVDGAIAKSLTQQTGGAGNQTQDLWVNDKGFINYTSWLLGSCA